MVISDQLVCAGMHAINAGLYLQGLEECDQDFFEFLMQCEKTYVERLETSVGLFQHFFQITAQADTPLFKSIQNAQLRYHALAAKHGRSVLPCCKHIERVSDLVSKLKALKRSFDGHKQDAQFVTLYTGCDIEQFWAEVLRYVLHNGEEMVASPKSTAGLVSFLESVGVAPSNIAELCACVTGREAVNAGDCKGVDKTATYYKFVTGQEIGRFLNLLLNCSCLCPNNPEDHILKYMDFLQRQGGVNWWSVLSGLMEAGCQYGQKGDQYLDRAWGKLMSDRFDLINVCQYLCEMKERLSSLPQSQDRLAQIVTNRLNRRLGPGRIWDQDCGMNWLFGKINGALHALQGYSAPGIRIEGVDVVNVGNMLSLMESMMQERGLDFLQLIVQCLPEKNTSGVMQGTERLKEDSLYRSLLEGRDTLSFLTKIVACKSQSKQKACNVLVSYLQNLGFKVVPSSTLGSLMAVISAQKPQSGEHAPIKLDQVWDMIKESEQWFAKDEQSKATNYRFLSDGRLYFSWESDLEVSHRASQAGELQKFGLSMTLLAE